MCVECLGHHPHRCDGPPTTFAFRLPTAGPMLFFRALFLCFATQHDLLLTPARRRHPPHGPVWKAATQNDQEEAEESSFAVTAASASPLIPSTEILPPFDASLFKAGAAVRRYPSGSILIDVENVRGKSGFALTHIQLLQGLVRWSRVCQLQGRLSLVVDHGSEATALYLPDVEMAVLFAGPTRKADDVIAHDVRFLGQELDVAVVTADGGIMDRCRRSAVQKGVHIVSPLHVLQDLELIAERTQTVVAEKPHSDNHAVSDEDDDTARALQLAQDLEYEIRVGAELLEAEALLRNKSSAQNRKRKAKLQAKIRKLREKLAQAPPVLQCITDVLTHGRQATSLGGLSSQDQNRLLQRWEKIRQRSNRKEKTGDRVVLAEHLRRQLTDVYGEATWNMTQGNATTSSSNMAMAHVRKVQAKLPVNVHSLLPTSSSIRLVVVSDTHGFESTLTPNGQALPPGDILLHLGDFAVDTGPQKKASLKAFDEWLARQPHPTKFVVRGNHDPRSLFFAESGATYITRPTTMTIAGLVFSFCPHVSGGMSNRMAPRRCDVLCSHVPPKNLLDACFSGSHAGSTTLRKAVEKMKTGPPVLWLCGHIHEARGVLRHSFVADRETLVINAANANSGMARCIEHGPVVLEISQEKGVDEEEGHFPSIRRTRRRRHGEITVNILSMDNAYTFANRNDRGFFSKESTSNKVREMLIAVDLGLRTGLALYSDSGQLLEYEHSVFESIEELEAGCLEMMARWEAKYQDFDGEQYHITKLAVEGADVALRNLWRNIAEDNLHCPLLLVKPEEWRADLLLEKEKATGEAAKEASRLIARQLVADYGDRIHVGKFPTDVAEAVLLGYHVARRLEWIPRKEPGVRRYSNGGVIVPKSIDASSASRTRAISSEPLRATCLMLLSVQGRPNAVRAPQSIPRETITPIPFLPSSRRPFSSEQRLPALFYAKTSEYSTTRGGMVWRYSRGFSGPLGATASHSPGSSHDKNDTTMNTPLKSLKPVQRKRQQRRKPLNRRPRNYWTEPENLAREIRLFWSNDCGLGDYNSSNVNCSTYDATLIPNESLMYYFGRHDLRAAFSSNGGREAVASLLGGARILPGRWKEAIQDPQIQILLEIDPALSTEYSPSSSMGDADETISSVSPKWSHQSDRRPKGFWNLQRVVQELYVYVDGVRQEHGRPAVWMPRPNEMAASGRDDLRQAIQRFGGTKRICKLAGMVPFREWYFFEGQLELLTLLKEYIEKYEHGDFSVFPIVSDIRRNGYEQLHSLIQYYGGRKYLAYRLGMSSGSVLPSDDFCGVSFGPFDLPFAIQLLVFVRQDHYHRSPPLSTPLLVMPSRGKLFEAGRADLDEGIERYGGYENVARRLGLAFFS